MLLMPDSLDPFKPSLYMIVLYDNSFSKSLFNYIYDKFPLICYYIFDIKLL